MDSFTLADVIEQNESGGIAGSIKFEPKTFQSFQSAGLSWARGSFPRIERLHNCDQVTAEMIAATSWGLYQIMGFNLYDEGTCNLQVDVGAYLASRELQAGALADFLRVQRIDFTVQEIEGDLARRLQFIRAYNGPGDVAGYWALTQRSIAFLRAAPAAG